VPRAGDAGRRAPPARRRQTPPGTARGPTRVRTAGGVAGSIPTGVQGRWERRDRPDTPRARPSAGPPQLGHTALHLQEKWDQAVQPATSTVKPGKAAGEEPAPQKASELRRVIRAVSPYPTGRDLRRICHGTDFDTGADHWISRHVYERGTAVRRRGRARWRRRGNRGSCPSSRDRTIGPRRAVTQSG
jgi:hypothetical protein